MYALRGCDLSITVARDSHRSLPYPPFQPLIQHPADCLHDLAHHVWVFEHPDKEFLVLLIPGGGHLRKDLLEEQNERLVVIVCGVA